MLGFHKVKGISMLPSFKANDYVLSIKTKKLKVNDVIILKTNAYGEVLKRISYISSKVIEVKSDNKEYPSDLTSSTYPLDRILGKVILKI
tara:strand:- start:1029 stop:1298 length:270 start_codon:yes stop_codon:yes gene_type:complete